jgi:hypothetical protein
VELQPSQKAFVLSFGMKNRRSSLFLKC